MKKNLIIHFILVLLLKIGVTGCTEETISMNADRMPDRRLWIILQVPCVTQLH